ncbi:hypothetical protein Nepgr_030312 [Nepenthes gracilis]|uniref:RING-type E3 ubiquitin transferase n=1 Tax=Nepenthes gracilis TaxID=150966 RepID=A0AAD3Y5Y2_NEPGR|nr:hypothetical protein Nepgr_030312 [Nepenthes gracilis]
MASEDVLIERLQQLQKQLGKKQTFEESLSSIKSLLRERYSSSSPTTRKMFYSVICRVATVMRTRYTAPGYLYSGLELFEDTERLTTDPSEKNHLRTCIAHIRGELDLHEESTENMAANNGGGRGGYLFEGHLTVDPEPPQPTWLVHQNLLASLAAAAAEGSSSTATAAAAPDSMEALLHGLIESLDNAVPDFLDDGTDTMGRRAPPASKEVVRKLPVIEVNEEILRKVGEDAECAICKEKLTMGDQMQEMPCKHTFHPPCLKPWLDEHNSCPICRHELPTDDHAYESWKEREKEEEEERRGAANALRGGEFMYI